MQPNVTLREMGPEDGARIATLGEQTPDTGAVAMRNLWHYDPYLTIMALHHNVVGVVAETPDHEGIVGMGMLRTGECLYEGVLRPYAYLFSLSVHPHYRRRGIASQLAAWRVAKARQLLGDEAVIFATIQQGNEGSLRNAAKWSTQRIDGRTMAGVAKVRTSPPRHIAGLEVRPAEVDDYEEIAQKQNAFYKEYNLYPPQTADALHAWHSVAPFGFPVREYLVVVDQQQNIVGGLSATDEGRVTTSHVVHLALPMRVANFVARILPADGIMKRIHVKDLWWLPNRLDAVHYLWESLRWLWRLRGTMVMSFADAQSPLAQIVKSPWYMPPQRGSLVIAAPVPVRDDRPLYLHI